MFSLVCGVFRLEGLDWDVDVSNKGSTMDANFG